MPVSVNLSALTPGHPDRTHTLTTALNASGLPSSQLVEHSLPTPVPEAGHAMHDLAEVGVRWALDDFGTGFSNLTRLKRLPFNILKLDRTLTTDLIEPSDTALVQAATTMASALGCEVIAEGIETQTNSTSSWHSASPPTKAGFSPRATPAPARPLLSHLNMPYPAPGIPPSRLP